MSEKLIGIDVGGTSARVAEFSGPDSDEIERQDRFAISGEYPKDLEQLVATITAVLDGEATGGIGVGLAGEFNDDHSQLIHSPNVKGWIEQPLRNDLSEAFDCPVALINDAEAGAWAEARFGGHQGDFWFITWGTGIGGSIVEQQPGGPRVIAAEPGHNVIRWDETSPICNCGKRGCFEAYVGGVNIEKRFGKPAAELSDEEWGDVTDWLARGLYDVIRTRPVREVVLGGGVTTKQTRHLPEIQRKLEAYLAGIQPIELTVAVHGEDAGVVGALAALRPNS